MGKKKSKMGTKLIRLFFKILINRYTLLSDLGAVLCSAIIENVGLYRNDNSI